MISLTLAFNIEYFVNYKIHYMTDKTKFDEIRQNLVEEQEKTLKKEERLNDSEKNQIWNYYLLKKLFHHLLF